MIARFFFKAFIFLCFCAGPLAAQDTWRSPRMMSDEWPRLSDLDCVEYGLAYGYHECGIMRLRRAPSVETPILKLPETRLSAPKTNARTASQIKPGHVNAASQRIPPPIPAPIRRPVETDGSCVENMKMCFSQCTGSGNVPATCNETCSTSTQCASTLRLNYVQFLDMQAELSQFVRKRVAEGGETQAAIADAPSAQPQQMTSASGSN